MCSFGSQKPWYSLGTLPRGPGPRPGHLRPSLAASEGPTLRAAFSEGLRHAGPAVAPAPGEQGKLRRATSRITNSEASRGWARRVGGRLNEQWGLRGAGDTSSVQGSGVGGSSSAPGENCLRERPLWLAGSSQVRPNSNNEKLHTSTFI